MTRSPAARRALTSFAALALLAMPACSEDRGAEPADAEPSERTLAEAISNADGLAAVASALGDTGLIQVFDDPRFPQPRRHAEHG